MVSCCEYGHEHLGSIKYRECLGTVQKLSVNEWVYNRVAIYVFLLEEFMYSYCCLCTCILIVRPCILIVVYVYLLLSTYS